MSFEGFKEWERKFLREIPNPINYGTYPSLEAVHLGTYWACPIEVSENELRECMKDKMKTAKAVGKELKSALDKGRVRSSIDRSTDEHNGLTFLDVTIFTGRPNPKKVADIIKSHI